MNGESISIHTTTEKLQLFVETFNAEEDKLIFSTKTYNYTKNQMALTLLKASRRT